MLEEPIVLPGNEGTMIPKTCSILNFDKNYVGDHSCSSGQGLLTAVSLDERTDILHCMMCHLRIQIPSGIAKKPAEFRLWCKAKRATQE